MVYKYTTDEILFVPGMYQCFVSAGGNTAGAGHNMAGMAAAGSHRQEAQASSELRLGGNFSWTLNLMVVRNLIH